MSIVIYGGSFNPPHTVHQHAVRHAVKFFKPDRLLVIPANLPPHKELEEDSPTAEQRLEMCRMNFAGIDKVEVSDMEIARGGVSYTADTVRALVEQDPEQELILLTGADMFRTLHTWQDATYILANTVVCGFPRLQGDMNKMKQYTKFLKKRFSAKVRLMQVEPEPLSSTDVRRALRNRGGNRLVQGDIYRFIVRNRLYGVQVNLRWLRTKGYRMLAAKRVDHVKGCEEEAVRLANRWGADPGKAAEAAILHDCTKRDLLPEQLLLCRKYGIVPDEIEWVNGKLLHAKTGAAVAEREFGMAPDVCDAIRWHTTGRPDMTLLEKVLYVADYIEPNRDFPGVEKLRELAYEDLDAALLMGLEMSLEDIAQRKEQAHPMTQAAADWYRERGKT